MKQKTVRKPKKRIKNKRKYYKALFARGVVVFVFMLLMFLILLFTVRHYVKKHDNGNIFNGIYIGENNVSGLDKEGAEKKLLEKLEKDSEKEIVLIIDEDKKETVTLGELNTKIKDMDKLVDDAYSYGREGSYFKRFYQIRKSESKKFKKEIPFSYNISEEGAEKGLYEKLGKFLMEPVDASVTMEGDNVVHLKEKKGEGIDIEATVSSVNKFLAEEWTGKKGSVKVTIKPMDADITDDDIKEVTDLLGTFTTFYGEDSGGRGKNVERGAALLDHKILMPGEEMSVENTMGARTTENGFFEANSYAADEVVSSIGGGICQVSTTLYNALLNAELEVIQRSSHSLKVGYVEISRDAAIAENLLDLKFVNNLDAPVYIESRTSGGYLTFNVYGKETRQEGRTLEFIGEVTDEKMPEKKKFEESEKEFGVMETAVSPKPAISARLLKVVYLNGEEQSREVMNYSSYLETKEVVRVGTVSDDSEATGAIKKAIASQNEDEIKKVIEKYKAKEANKEKEGNEAQSE